MGTGFNGGKKILVIDNHDSFVFNIVQYLDELGAATHVVKNDEIDPDYCKNFAGVVISPGPGNPQSAGVSIGAVKFCAQEKIPILGICLGLQVIGAAYGAKISSAPELLHGRTSGISHRRENIVGVQFHPEAVLTQFGYELLANWLELCGDVGARNRAVGLSALVNNS